MAGRLKREWHKNSPNRFCDTTAVPKPYTQELTEFYECTVNEKEPKSSAQAARHDVELSRMILRAGLERYSAA